MEDIDKNGDGLIDLDEYIGEAGDFHAVSFLIVDKCWDNNYVQDLCHRRTLKQQIFLIVIGDMYNQEGDATEPEWVKTERDQFTEFRDKNKDGKMDKDETRDWILPNDYDHAEAEAKHLVYESDTDKVRSVKLQHSTKKNFGVTNLVAVPNLLY